MQHRPYSFYYEIPESVREYIITNARLTSITDIPLEEINNIFSDLPEDEYLMILNIERKSQKYLQ